MPNANQNELGATEGLCPQELTLNPSLLAQLVFNFKASLHTQTYDMQAMTV